MLAQVFDDELYAEGMPFTLFAPLLLRCVSRLNWDRCPCTFILSTWIRRWQLALLLSINRQHQIDVKTEDKICVEFAYSLDEKIQRIVFCFVWLTKQVFAWSLAVGTSLSGRLSWLICSFGVYNKVCLPWKYHSAAAVWKSYTFVASWFSVLTAKRTDNGVLITMNFLISQLQSPHSLKANVSSEPACSSLKTVTELNWHLRCTAAQKTKTAFSVLFFFYLTSVNLLCLCLYHSCSRISILTFACVSFPPCFVIEWQLPFGGGSMFDFLFFHNGRPISWLLGLLKVEENRRPCGACA